MAHQVCIKTTVHGPQDQMEKGSQGGFVNWMIFLFSILMGRESKLARLLKMDDDFATMLEGVVKQFQQRHGLVPDGKIGEATRTVMAWELIGENDPAWVLESFLSRTDPWGVLLNALGCEVPLLREMLGLSGDGGKDDELVAALRDQYGIDMADVGEAIKPRTESVIEVVGECVCDGAP